MSESSAPEHPRRGWRNSSLAVVWAAAVAGLVFVWWGWDPVLGHSMRTSVTYGIVLLTFLLTILWVVGLSSWKWSTVAAFLTLVVAGVGVLIASVRSLELTGDMGLVVDYRWEPTRDELLARHRQQSDAAPLAAVTGPVATPEDMPAYRGTGRDGVVVGPALSQDWQAAPPRELWRQPVGGGYSQFAVVGDLLVTLEQRGDNEAVVCYDATSGRERWVHEYPALFQEAMGGPGPRSTPTVDGADAFTIGAEGDLLCLNLADGAVRWSRDVLPPEAPNVQWAISSSPLVVGDLVIVNPGGPDGDGLMAVDRHSGETVWQRPGVARLLEGSERNWAGYSSPVMVTLLGVEQLLSFDGWGLRSYQLEAGTLLWEYEFQNGPGVNVAQPVILDETRIFLAASYGEGCRMIQVSRSGEAWDTPQTLWQNLNMRCKFTSPVLFEGFLYGLDEGILVCLDPETGERQWKRGRFGHGQLLLTGGQLLVLSESGDVVLVEASPEEFREIARFNALSSGKTWNPLALVRGRLYVRDHREMAAYDLRANPVD